MSFQAAAPHSHEPQALLAQVALRGKLRARARGGQQGS